jgi:hypothetical protein
MAPTTSVVTVPVFGLGIRPLGAEHLAQAADGLHHVGCGDQGVEGGPAFFLNLLDELVAAGELGAGGFGFGDLVAGGDDGDDLGLAEAVGQDDRAANHLVGVLGVDAQTEGQVDGLVELGELGFLQEGDCVGQGVRAVLHERARLHHILAFFCHTSSSPTA